MGKFVLMTSAGKVQKNKGFTLIETLIALLIVSISLSALVGSYGQNARYLQYFKDKTLSTLLINNLIVERRLGPKLNLGRSSDSIDFGYKTWYWSSVVTKFELENVLQVQLQVFASKADRDEKKAIQSQKIYVQQ